MATNTGICPKCNQVNAYSSTNCIDCDGVLPWADLALKAMAPPNAPATSQVTTTPAVHTAAPFAERWATMKAALQKELGSTLMIIGGVMVIYYQFVLDVSVPVDAGFLGITRINNIELMAQSSSAPLCIFLLSPKVAVNRRSMR